MAEQQEAGTVGLSWADARMGIVRTHPIAFSGFLFGILYGASCVAIGVSPWVAALASLLILSGAVQFAALGLMNGDNVLIGTAISSFLIATRQILLGASIARHLADRPLGVRYLSMPLLTDGNWAAMMGEKGPYDRLSFFLAGGAWIVALWAAGTLLGGLIADRIPDDTIVALGFSGTVFLSLLLLVVQRNTRAPHLPWIVSLAVSILLARAGSTEAAFLIGASSGGLTAWITHVGRKAAEDE